MSTDTEAPIQQKSSLEFKSTSFSVPVLVIFNPELKQIEYQLEEKISQAPDFFKNSPILIDLKEINHNSKAIDLVKLIECLHEKKLIPIGISGGSDEQNTLALDLHIPPHTMRGAVSKNRNSSTKKLSSNGVEEAKELSPTQTESQPAIVENMLISQPIRSGQRIYAKGDLTILSHVSAGAEVMAEGNIHIYGALRGRALAGVQGNIESRIFCSDLQAELISIAGHYKTSEELDGTEKNKPTQIYLQDQALITKNL